jgi:hypothetical protein
MKKRIVEWLISKMLKGYHLHLNPTRKVSPFTAPPPEFSMDGPTTDPGTVESKTSPAEDQYGTGEEEV